MRMCMVMAARPVQAVQAPHLACDPALPAAPPFCPGLLQLVFSDEFNSPGRKMGVGAGDPRWTADNLWYLGTFDEEVYTPEQVWE